MSDDPSPSSIQPAKRKRVTKACLICAKSRRKCDGVQPFCGTCRTQGTQCAWSDVPTRRGPPKGYRRGTADPTSLTPKIHKIREHVQALQVSFGDKLVLDELHKAIYNSSTCAGGTNATESSTTGTPETPETLRHSTPTTSVDRSDSTRHSMSKMKSEMDMEDQDDHSNSSEVDEGSSSGMAFLATSMRYMHTGSQAGVGSGPLTPVSDGERLPMEKFSPWALRDKTVERHPLVRRKSVASTYIPQPKPADVEILLKTYWSSIHPHWPILYKPSYDAISLFRIYHEVPLALLYAIYSLSARLSPTAELNVTAAETFLRVAEEELQGEGTFRSDINTCIALFLLSLYYHGEGNQRQAWVHCGVAAMMALDLGLHKSAKNLPLVEHERRVRVFWNIFVYEKVLAAEMGRPVLIRMVHCDPVRLSEEQSDEYETVVHPGSGGAVRLYTISIFNAAVDLFRIFERILSEVHTVPSLTSSSSRSARERLVQELDHDLERWQEELGPRCAYPRADDQQPTRTLYLTHAWYHVAIILLHRPLIARPRVGHTFVSNVHHRKATDHANLLVDLLAQFAEGQEIDKLPPNDAYLIFTAAILHVFNLSVNDKHFRDAARPRLEQCIGWLQGLAETWSAASQYKQLLAAFSQVATNTISHSHTLSPASLSSSSSQHVQHSAQSMAYHTQDQNQSQNQSRGNIPYLAHQPADHIPEGSPPNAGMLQQQYAGEVEQKYAAVPQIFNLENYFWNDFQNAYVGQQVGGYYPQQHATIPAQPAGEFYENVIRILQEPGRHAEA